jgi:hypothetical protein
MNRYKALGAATLALLFLAACGSTGMGDILGGGNQPNTAGNYEIRGTVDSVDPNGRSIYLTNVSGYTSMLSSGANNVRVYYDENTRVEYEGNVYRPENLERGDEVAVRVDEEGNVLVAESMRVLRDVSGGSTSPGGTGDTYGSTVRGTVTYIDSSRRTIEVDRGYGSKVMVEFDSTTPVYFNNQTYRVTDLERGDEIDIRVRDLGSGRLLAQDVTVTRSISGGTSGSQSGTSTVRGTVSYVDTARRTIELTSASWINRFDAGSSAGNRIVIQYGTSASVEVSGQMYPIGGLERGDVIEVQVTNAGSTTPLAQRIILVRDVNDLR